MASGNVNVKRRIVKKTPDAVSCLASGKVESRHGIGPEAACGNSRQQKAAADVRLSSVQAVRTLVINLERRSDRWIGIQKRLAKVAMAQHLMVERLPATDGITDAIPEDVVTLTWTTDRNARYDGRKGYRPGISLDMTPGERGCAMSHVRAWQLVASGGVADAPVLILEDDVVFAKGLVRRIKGLLASIPEDTDALYLGYIKGAPWRCKVAPGLYEAKYLWTTVAYLLWPRGAQKLLAALPVDEPVDNFMAWQMAKGCLKTLAVEPALADQEQEWDVGSDVPHSDDVVLTL